MDKKFSIQMEHYEMRCFEGVAAFFSQETHSIHLLDWLQKWSTVLSLKFPVREVFLTKEYLYAIGENLVQKYSLKATRLLSTFVVPGVIGFLELPNHCILICRKETITVYNRAGHVEWEKKYEYIQKIEDYLVIITPDDLAIYKNFIGRVYSEPIHQFEEQFSPVFRRNIGSSQCELKAIHFSLHNNKLYLFVNNRVIGKDLNIYLDDLPNFNNNTFNITKLQCVSKMLALLDTSNKKICVILKNFEKILLMADCEEFYYDGVNDQLFILYGQTFQVYKEETNLKISFQLVDESIIYKEAEDEFDESANSNCDIFLDISNS